MFEIQEGGVGILLVFTVLDENGAIMDVSLSTSIELIFRKSDDEVITRVGTFHTDGTDGLVDYHTVAGDLTVSGEWLVQAKITTNSHVLFSRKKEFTVLSNIKDLQGFTCQ